MKLQLIFFAVILGSTVGLPVPESNLLDSGSDEFGDNNPHAVERRAISTSACLHTLHIMAFTSGLVNAGADTHHSVEILANGQVRHVQLYDRPGDDMLEHKGDLWTIAFSSFHFTDECITIGEIERVTIVERNDDGWNIDSIVTIVIDSGGAQLLTQDFNVNRWIDGDSHHSHRRFELTHA